MNAGKNAVAYALRLFAHLAAAGPAGYLVYRATNGLLGADPVAELTHQTGSWALRFLWLCLAMTPLRRLLSKAWPIQYRRMLGLYAFGYASVHLSIYVVLDLGGYWPQLLEDLVKRPFIVVGALAWMLLLPLALTSTRAAMRRLGRHWGRLHRSVYAVALLALLHFVWLVKADLREPLLYAALLALLFAARWRPLAAAKRVSIRKETTIPAGRK